MAMECPACHAEMGPNDMQCPICLRPRSRRELMESLNAERRAEDARRKRPYRIAGVFFIVFAAGFLYKKLDQLGYYKHSVPQPAAPAPVAVSTPAAQVPEVSQPAAPVDHSTSAYDSAIAQALAESRQHVAAEPPPVEKKPEDWTVSGTVYDLISLKAAAGARLTFTDHSSGAAFNAKADAHGRYRLHLPKLKDGGYEVKVAAKGYRGDYLEEASPPFANRTTAGRQEAAADAAQSAVLHVPIFLDKDVSLEYNLALLPHE